MMEKHAKIAEKAEKGESPLGPNFLDEVEAADIREREDWEVKPDLLRVIDALLEDDNYYKAWKKGKELLEEDYDSSEFHRRLADIAEELNKPEVAETHYKEATRLDPNNAMAFHHYGNFLKHQGRQEEASDRLKKAIDVSESPTIFNDFGLLLFQTGNYDQAKDIFERGIQISDGGAIFVAEVKRLHYNYGHLLFHSGDLEGAYEQYQQAIEYDQNYANPKFGLAQIESERGNYEKAFDLFEEAISRHAEQGRFEKWKKVLLSCVSTLSDNGQYEDAVQQCDYGIKMAESLGQRGQMLAMSLQSKKKQYEEELQKDR